MKKTFVLFFLLIPIHTFSQSKFSLGISGHTIFPRYETNRVGYGVTLDFSYKLFTDLEFMLSTGYMAYGNNINNNYSMRLLPEILGVKYYLYQGFADFYFLGEIQKVFGERRHENYIFNEELDKPVPHGMNEYNYREFSTAVGIGSVLKITDGIHLDLNINSTITSKSNYLQNIRLVTGLKYQL